MKTTARRDEKELNFVIWCSYIRDFTVSLPISQIYVSRYHALDSLSDQRPFKFNPLRPRQNGRHFADDIFNSIFINENVWIPIKISLKFVPNGLIKINNIPALVQIMAWRRPGDKPLSEPMMV